jgi:hypothetical protein
MTTAPYPTPSFVIPAKAGTQGGARDLRADWVPAFAGMTRLEFGDR